MKVLALTILSITTVKSVIEVSGEQSSESLDNLAYILFPTVIMYLMYMGAI